MDQAVDDRLTVQRLDGGDSGREQRGNRLQPAQLARTADEYVAAVIAALAASDRRQRADDAVLRAAEAEQRDAVFGRRANGRRTGSPVLSWRGGRNPGWRAAPRLPRRARDRLPGTKSRSSSASTRSSRALGSRRPLGSSKSAAQLFFAVRGTRGIIQELVPEHAQYPVVGRQLGRNEPRQVPGSRGIKRIRVVQPDIKECIWLGHYLILFVF